MNKFKFTGAGSSQAVSRNVLTKQARMTTKRYGAAAAQRMPVVALSSRLVLMPTGNGSWDHIGEKVPLPQPIELKDGVYEVGRAEPADILIQIPTVSSRHALLRVEDDKVSITDLNSTNGTVVNGQELNPMDNVELAPGAEIIFGDMYLARFQLDEVDSSTDNGKDPNNAAGL
jgi:hypothetical protein